MEQRLIHSLQVILDVSQKAEEESSIPGQKDLQRWGQILYSLRVHEADGCTLQYWRENIEDLTGALKDLLARAQKHREATKNCAEFGPRSCLLASTAQHASQITDDLYMQDRVGTLLGMQYLHSEGRFYFQMDMSDPCVG